MRPEPRILPILTSITNILGILVQGVCMYITTGNNTILFISRTQITNRQYVTCVYVGYQYIFIKRKVLYNYYSKRQPPKIFKTDHIEIYTNRPDRVT